MNEYECNCADISVCCDKLRTVLTEVSNLKLANNEARKTIDRLNTLIPREANDSPDSASGRRDD